MTDSFLDIPTHTVLERIRSSDSRPPPLHGYLSQLSEKSSVDRFILNSNSLYTLIFYTHFSFAAWSGYCFTYSSHETRESAAHFGLDESVTSSSSIYFKLALLEYTYIYRSLLHVGPIVLLCSQVAKELDCSPTEGNTTFILTAQAGNLFRRRGEG